MNSTILATEQGHDLTTVLGNSLVILVSFVLLLVILNKFALGPIMNMIDQREKTIEDQLNHAKEVEALSKKKEEEAQKLIEDAQKRAQSLMASAKESSEKLKDESLAQARAEAIRIRQEAQETSEKERDELMRQATEKMGEVSVLLTQKLLNREIKEEDHHRLIHDFIEGLEN